MRRSNGRRALDDVLQKIRASLSRKTVEEKTMKAVFCVALTLGVMAGVAAHAVERSQRSDTSSPRLTVIGCIQRSTPSPAATTATTALPEGATKYVLSNITLAADPATAAAPAASAIAEAVKMYRLDDAADSQLAPHVGDRVEVVGTLSASPSVPRGTSGTTESADEPAANKAPILKVESVRTIATASPMCGR
jgi:hypothetical protein